MGAANVCTNVNIYVDICDKAAAVWDYLHLLSGDEECSDFTRSPTVPVQECERFSCLTVHRGPGRRGDAPCDGSDRHCSA